MKDILANQNISNKVFHRLSELQFEYVAVLDAVTGEMKMLKRQPEAEQSIPYTEGDYAKLLSEAELHAVAERERRRAEKALSLTQVKRELEKKDPYACSFSTLTAEKEVRHKKWEFTYVDKEHKQIAVTRSDVTLLYDAETDYVSGALNREAFLRYVREWLNEHPDQECAMLAFDIDRFKVFNELFGMDEGDRLLHAIGSNMRSAQKQGVLGNRGDADRFTCFLPVDGQIIEKSVEDCQRKLNSYREDYCLSAHFGVYEITDKSIPVSVMCDRAMLAKQSIKQRPDVHLVWYNDDMRISMLCEQQLEQELRKGLTGSCFVPYLQPQYDHVNGEMIGAEALARWPKAPGEIHFPADFIYVLERTGMVTQLDLMMFEKVCTLLHKWQEKGLKVVPVSINLSRRDIYVDDLCDVLCEIAEVYHIDHHLLNLEITETAYTENPEQAIGAINKLRDAGFLIEMDDFGSGYSSLNSLKKLPVDILKLDLKFLEDGEDGKSGVILNSVVQMAHWMNLRVIAEGVETARQADYLKTIDCRFVQGYFYARPMPAREFEQLLSGQKVEQRVRDMSIAGFFNTGEFWNPDAQSTVIFNTFVGAAGIFVLDGEVMYAERLNDMFYQETGMRRGQLQGHINILDYCFEEDKPFILEKLDQARSSEEEVVFEARFYLADEERIVVWDRIRCRCIAKASSRSALYVAVENINERKNLEEKQKVLNKELLAEKEKTEIVLENAMISIWDYDRKNRKCYWHSRMKNDFRLENVVISDVPESIIQSGSIFPESIKDYLSMYQAIAQGEQSVTRTIHTKNQSGGDMWQKIVYWTTFEEGTPVGAIGFSIDVTDRVEKDRRYEQEMHYLEEVHSENLIDKGRIDISTGILESYSSNLGDPKFHVGMTFDEILDILIETAYSEEQKTAIRKAHKMNMLEHYSESSKMHQFEYQRVLHPGESPVWVRLSVKLYEDPISGDIKAFLYAHDVNEQVQVREVMDKIYDNKFSMIGVLELTKKQVHIYQMTRYEREQGIRDYHDYSQAISQFISAFIVEEERQNAISVLSLAHIAEEMKLSERYSCSFHVMIEGSIHFKKWEFSTLDKEHTRILITREDVTELFEQQKEQEEKLHNALEAAKQASIAKTTFLNNMSHDIRTPLNAIINMARITREDYQQITSGDVLNDLDKLEISGDFLLGLVNDILDVSRIESGKMELHPSVYRYEEFQNYISCIFEPLCEQKKQKFLWEKGEYDCPLYVDKIRFNQIFFNLLSNAVKYTQEGGTIHFRVYNGQMQDNCLDCCFDVSDNGMGMSKHFQEVMFHPFEREEKGNEGVVGTGLGLSIVNNLVNMMGGSIRVQSELHQGTTFTVQLTLPVATNEQLAEQEQAEHQQPVQYEQLAGKKIMIVEDNSMNRLIIQRLLQKYRADLTEAVNGQEAVALFKKSPQGTYSCILMDVRMPVMDGLRATREIRKLEGKKEDRVPIIAMTANAFDEDKQASRDAGMTGYLMKPIVPDLMYETIIKQINPQ